MFPFAQCFSLFKVFYTLIHVSHFQHYPRHHHSQSSDLSFLILFLHPILFLRFSISFTIILHVLCFLLLPLLFSCPPPRRLSSRPFIITWCDVAIYLTKCIANVLRHYSFIKMASLLLKTPKEQLIVKLRKKAILQRRTLLLLRAYEVNNAYMY